MTPIHKRFTLAAAAGILFAAPATATDLALYNWADYFGETTIADYQAETGTAVSLDYFDANEVLETKLLTGGSGYDVVFPAASNAERVFTAGALVPIDPARLDNYANLDPEILAALDRVAGGRALGVPYTWGTIGIAYNTAKIAERLGDAPVETQVLHFDGEAWAGYSYRWNENGTDADLVPAEGEEFDVSPESWKGGSRYRIVSRAECMRCHNMWNQFTPAFNPMQLSGFSAYPREPVREAAAALGISNSLFFHQDEAKGHLAQSRGRGTVEKRARSWLHANCSHCHRRHGGGSAPLELNFDRTLSESVTLWQKPTRGDFGLTDACVIVPGEPWRSVLNYRVSSIGNGHMPPLGSREIDAHGAKLLWDWVANLPVETPSVEAEPSRLTDSVSDAFRLSHRMATGEREESVIAEGLSSQNRNISALFERFRAPDERPVPAKLDHARLLTLRGDAGNGAKLLSPTGKLSACFACHQIGDTGAGVLGPDLAGVGKRLDRRKLLDSLTKPSATIAPEYRVWILELKNGESLSGFLVEQTETSTSLRLATGQVQEISATEILSAESQSLSLMPEGLLDLLAEQEAADVLAYLESLR